MEPRSIAERLAEPFDPAEVKFKPQMVKNNRALAMGYIDARIVQDRLDEVVGVDNWSDEYTIVEGGSVVCRLSVNMAPRDEPPKLVVKMDVGSPSEQPDTGDRMKAAFSDALKRTAVKFGIGRYLYRLAAQWVDYDPVKKQLTQLPLLPTWAVPESCKPCGVQTANQILALSGQVAELERKNKGDVQAELMSRYGYKQADALAKVQKRHATAMFQDLHEAIKKAATQPSQNTQTTQATKATDNAIPKDGKELYDRLSEYSIKLCNDGLFTPSGAMLEFVKSQGVLAGYPADIREWKEPAISLGVNAAKEFEKKKRAEKIRT